MQTMIMIRAAERQSAAVGPMGTMAPVWRQATAAHAVRQFKGLCRSKEVVQELGVVQVVQG